MKLSAKMLCEAVSQAADVTLVETGKNNNNVKFLCFYDGNPEILTSCGAYLADLSQIPPKTSGVKDILWITKAEKGRVIETDATVIVFHGQVSDTYIFSLIQRVVVALCAWEEILDNLVKDGKSVQEIIDEVQYAFAHPLCVVDSSQSCLGYSNDLLDCYANENENSVIVQDRDLDLVAELRGRDFSVGMLYMIHTDVPFSPKEKIAFDLLADKLSQALRNMAVLSAMEKNTFKEKIKKLFETGQTEEEELYRSLAEWGGEKGDTFLCYKVKASHFNCKINAEYMCGFFENALHTAVVFWYDAILVVLADQTRSQCSVAELDCKMKELLQQVQLKAGVSLPFTDLPRVWFYFKQACCAFEEGYPIEKQETIYYFQKYVSSYMLHQAMGEFPLSFLVDAGLQRLIEHDHQYSVSYVETLNAFFRCKMNVSHTADALKIHRTSLMTRMQKIRELLGCDMTQEYILYLQMILAIYNKNQ